MEEEERANRQRIEIELLHLSIASNLLSSRGSSSEVKHRDKFYPDVKSHVYVLQ